MLHINSYQLFENGLELNFNNGTKETIYFTNDSGKVYFRYKIGQPNVKHPGVFLGFNQCGVERWIHNHYNVGTAHIVQGDEFRKGMNLYVYKEYCINSQQTVIKKAMEHVMRSEQYKPYSYNCQTLVNDACNNQRKSEDAEAALKGVLATVAVVGLIGLIFGE